MIFNYFRTFQDESQLLVELLGQSDQVQLRAVSSETPIPQLICDPPAQGWLVDSRAVREWQIVLNDVRRGSRAPIILCDLISSNTERLSARLKFDGYLFIDLSLPAEQLRRLIQTTFNATHCLTHDSAHPYKVESAADGLRSITHSDPTNTRILNLITHGLSDRSISASMCLSRQTVRNRISRMLHDGGFENRTSLALYYAHANRYRVTYELFAVDEPALRTSLK